MKNRIYIAIDLKSFYASVEYVERKLDPMDVNLVVADPERTEKTICLAVSPSLKSYGIPGRPRLFEVIRKVREINQRRLIMHGDGNRTGASLLLSGGIRILLRLRSVQMEKNQIYKIYGTCYQKMTKQLLEAAELEKMIPEKTMRIGMKPNLVSPSEASYGATTHPEIVEGIIEYLQERGFKNLVIMEGSWVGDRTSEAVEVCGYQRLIEQYDVEFRDMQKDTWHIEEYNGMELAVCDEVEKIDFLINVPVLKGHCQTKITCALKNMKGLIPNREKRHFHAMGLHKPIAYLNGCVKQDFIVIDHICGDLDFEDGGNPVVRNCIMAAIDPVLADAYGCSLLHYQTEEVPYIEIAEELGVGSKDLEKAQIVVCGDEKGQEEQELPYARKVVELQDAVEEVESCSACYGYLLPALQKLKEEGLLEKLETRICIGQGYKNKTGKLGIGNCTRSFEYSVKGCPPTETEIYDALKEYIMKN